jgi:drug/metabolite transporter (DMT)-like permease
VARGDFSGGGFHGGELLIIVANVAWTWFSLAAQRWLRGASLLHISLLTTIPGAACMTVVTLAAGAAGIVELKVDLAPEFLLPVIYIGTVPIAIGNYLWHYGVGRIGIAVASMYTNLIPVTAALVAFVWVGTHPTLNQLVGAVIIIAGVLYAQLAALRAGRQTLVP